MAKKLTTEDPEQVVNKAVAELALLPDHYEEPNLQNTEILCAEGFHATRESPYPAAVQAAYAKGLRPALAGQGVILNEGAFMVDPKTGQLLDGEMPVFIERMSHYQDRLQAAYQKALDQRHMIASMNTLGDRVSGIAPGVKVNNAGTSLSITDTDGNASVDMFVGKPLSPQAQNQQSMPDDLRAAAMTAASGMTGVTSSVGGVSTGQASNWLVGGGTPTENTTPNE